MYFVQLWIISSPSWCCHFIGLFNCVIVWWWIVQQLQCLMNSGMCQVLRNVSQSPISCLQRCLTDLMTHNPRLVRTKDFYTSISANTRHLLLGYSIVLNIRALCNIVNLTLCISLPFCLTKINFYKTLSHQLI